MGDTGEALAAPEGYAELLEQLKTRVRTAQLRAARAANTEVLRLYWSIGRDILDRQHDAGWGAKVVDRLAADLRSAFPDQRGLVAAQPAVHARPGSSMAGRWVIRATACCTNAVGPPHRAPRPS